MPPGAMEGVALIIAIETRPRWSERKTAETVFAVTLEVGRENALAFAPHSP